MALKNFKTKNGIDVDSYTIPSSSVQTTVKTSSATTLDTIALSSFKSIEYLVTISQAAKTRSSKVILQTDGTSVDMTEYAITETGGSISGVVVSATVVSTNVLLQITVSDAATTLARVKGTKNSGDLFKSVISDAPVIGTTTSTVPGEASVAFTAPYDDGASTITSYTAFSNTGGYSGTLSQAGSGSIPVVDMLTGTYSFTVKATNANGISEASSSSNSVSVTSSVNTWVTKTAMPQGGNGTLGAVVGTDMYVIGGYNIYTNRVYDTVANTWSTRLNVPVSTHECNGAVIGTKIYRLGGRDGYNANYVYDTVANTWSALTNVPGGVGDAATCAVGTKIHLMGGKTSPSTFTSTNHQIYDTVTNTWTTGTALPEILFGASAIAVGTLIYLINGYGLYNNFQNTVRVYDTVTSTWSSVANHPVAKYRMFTQYRNGIIYTAGGSNNSGSNSLVHAYNISTNTWSAKASMPAANHQGASGMVGSKMFVIGGDNNETVNYMYQT